MEARVRRDPYHARPAVTRALGFCGLIRKIAPFSRQARDTEYSF